MRAPVRYLSPRLPCGGGVWGGDYDTRGNPGLRAPAPLSCHLVTEAPAFSVVADVAIVKGETPADDLTWLSFPDGTARRETVRVIHDLPHLVVESVFGLDEGLWGTLATQRFPGLRLVADAPLDDHAVAKAAVKAVLNRWNDGPDTPSGVRARLRRSGRGPGDLAGRLTDEQIRVATAGVRRLYRDWAALPIGGRLRATWPLHDSWLHLL
jgi:hypothetical protein